ncbi:hypothetical protein [Curtobacterium sp. MCBD17_040]|uniref:hypothetical protein n=1 Tax=Curtobacterium sp. MCBD17_040 TaxID=2175674 RepID=UPI000DA81C15|nr:hypothetical protein [Curtobacterium sp. MCBD17_040]WIB65896.1 hypothetical protein DEI94_17425 [Curtobacterium sp. MCBD17_040]
MTTIDRISSYSDRQTGEWDNYVTADRTLYIGYRAADRSEQMHLDHVVRLTVVGPRTPYDLEAFDPDFEWEPNSDEVSAPGHTARLSASGDQVWLDGILYDLGRTVRDADLAALNFPETVTAAPLNQPWQPAVPTDNSAVAAGTVSSADAAATITEVAKVLAAHDKVTFPLPEDTLALYQDLAADYLTNVRAGA